MILLIGIGMQVSAQKQEFSYLDVYKLEYVSDPQIDPDGSRIVYRRMGFDIMKDKADGNLWIVKSDGSGHQKLTSCEASEHSPRWSPNGDRIAFISTTTEGAEIYMYWLESNKLARISQLPFSPGSLTWSPKGDQLAFSMNVEKKPPVIAKIPSKPKGAQWAEPPRITDRLYHEADGRGYIKPGFNHIFVIPAQGGARGYIKPGFNHIFVIPAQGGAIRQITSDDFHHRGQLTWSAQGDKIYFSANRTENWEYDFRNSEIYEADVATGRIQVLTDRQGPDKSPVVSPNGKYIAYLGFEDKVQTYQVTKLQIMNIDGTSKRVISETLDRSIKNMIWDEKSSGLYISYDDKGNTKISHITLDGKITKLADNLGGTSIGRPYAGGSFSASSGGNLAYTHSRPAYPAELAIVNGKSKKTTKITSLNKALFDYRDLGKVEEVWYESSVDQRQIQGWVVYPPDYDENKKYPFLVENHGGPVLNYGDRFSAEIQLYASAGYIVFYPNARGSTSYGEEFGNLLFNNYPGEDYNDVMDGVDYCIKKGIAHEDQLFVTGGSAGGIMTAWIIGKNNRFEAAVVAKPVMNWISKTLVADNYFGYANSRYPGQPWENFEGYWNFSPLSLVGNIETPSMVMVGMEDLRTPPSEAKQLYHALKLRKIETVLVEIPGASHGIANKPSNLITKIAHTIAWFEKYRK
ncbi:S9 family peptidase [uncultured Eudoraea sp.]|uniref:S9 family peptidase n=1 Tax=uncultured Eudoraea sp. TaxID=1035614 RepID=UPI00263293BC|nr:S9 family peptidase [uncultured Eudoraea sp.]